MMENYNFVYKFENLEVWSISLDINDMVYSIAERLPNYENFNLNQQIRRASTSICLNIAEGSTLVSNREQKNYLKIAFRSLIEVIACLRIISRRKYMNNDDDLLMKLKLEINKLFAKLSSFIKSLN